MKDAVPFAERLAPDTIARLQQAAHHRFATADLLRARRKLAAVYFYGYSAEICLSAAYFRSAGFPRNAPIDSDTRRRRMAQARQLRGGTALMSSDPHPLIGWARLLQSQRRLMGNLTSQDEQRLVAAINKATLIYAFWRPELRYKTVEVASEQVEIVQGAARWLLENHLEL